MSFCEVYTVVVMGAKTGCHHDETNPAGKPGTEAETEVGRALLRLSYVLREIAETPDNSRETMQDNLLPPLGRRSMKGIVSK